MYYFPNRAVAGEQLAKVLMPKYRFEDCAVIALGDGAVVVAAQIAAQLHCVLSMLLVEQIALPMEIDPVEEINHLGGITFNDMYTAAELEEIKADNFSYLEQQKIQKLFDMNKLLGQGGIINPRLLRNRNVIVVSDGLANGFSMHAAADFLKPILVKRLVMVTPFATVSAVDQMHILADEIVCLNVIENLISVDHYYDTNDLPEHSKVIKIIEDIILHWK